jgi:hypothetical protein
MTRKVQQSRIKLLFEADRSPSFIDLLKPYGYGHIAIFATHQSGRDSLTFDILSQAVAAKIPVLALDFRQMPSGTTIERFTHSHKGDYINVLSDANRYFEMPKPKYVCEYPEEIYHAFIHELEETLAGFILGDSQDSILAEKTRVVLNVALRNFFEHQKVSFKSVKEDKDSYTSQKTLNLEDFLHFCQTENIEQSNKSGAILDDVFEVIDQRIKLILDSRIGQAITSSTFLRSDAKVKVFAIEQAVDTEEALQLQLLALNLLFREALSYRSSVVFIDNVSNLCRSDILSEQIGRLCAISAKFGVQVILRSNEIETISHSKGGRIILENIRANLIGYIQAPDVAAFERILNLPLTLIERNARLPFKPNNGYSNWLIVRDGDRIAAQHQPSKSNLQLAAAVGAGSSSLR